MKVILKPSDRDDKKYDVIIDDKKIIRFGSKGMSDYTLHGDTERKTRYILRHQKRENWNDPYTAGFWSRWVLWNKPTISESIKDIQKRFSNIKITKI
jgi:hypothetical protein